MNISCLRVLKIYFFLWILITREDNKRGYPLLLIMNSKQEVQGNLGHEM